MAREQSGALTQLALQRATAALRDGEPADALKWLESVPTRDRPNTLEAEIRYGIAKVAIANGDWGRARRELEAVVRAEPSSFYQSRLERVRRRAVPMDDATWRVVRKKIDVAKRLPPVWLAPVISTVYACGAYHSRGQDRWVPWSRLLRQAKDPPRDEAERAPILKVTCDYICRYIATDTQVLRHVDVVVAVPPDPIRYARRGMSLPDNLAGAVERQLALPWAKEALVKSKSVELRGLSWPERRAAVKGSMVPRDVALLKDRCVLLVDDVTTSGATLCEAAAVLRAIGARDVHAVTLCHTEG